MTAEENAREAVRSKPEGQTSSLGSEGASAGAHLEFVLTGTAIGSRGESSKLQNPSFNRPVPVLPPPS